MNGWVKHFSDGASELGSDTLVRAKKASWRHGRQEGLVAVDLHWQGKMYTLSCGEGEYWQSDTMVSNFTRGRPKPPKMLTRRISRKIDLTDVGKNIIHYQNTNVVRVRLTDAEDPVTENYVSVTEDLVNKWLTMEVQGDTGKVKITLQPTRK
jgi:hypothetical protein